MNKLIIVLLTLASIKLFGCADELKAESDVIKMTATATAVTPPDFWLYRKVYNPVNGQVMYYCRYTTPGQFFLQSFPTGFPMFLFYYIGQVGLGDTTKAFMNMATGLAAAGVIATQPGLAGALQTEYGGYDSVSGKTFVLQGTGANTVTNNAPQNAALLALIDSVCGVY